MPIDTVASAKGSPTRLLIWKRAIVAAAVGVVDLDSDTSRR